jgi:adenosylcobinamide-GDP ribazoletransferase
LLTEEKSKISGNFLQLVFRDFFTALTFLTVVPWPQSKKESGGAFGNLAASMSFFPFVGFLIAVASLAIVFILEPFVSARFSNLLLVLIPVLITGGLHLDGFSDFFDGFFQGKDRGDILRIMKDSRVGVWGAASIVFLILFQWELLNMVTLRNPAFLLALTTSRFSHALLSFRHSYAGTEGGLGSYVTGYVTRTTLIGAAFFTFALAACLGWVALGTCLGALVFILLAGTFIEKRIGGMTGDTLGAVGEMTELAVFLLILVLTHFIT